MRRVAFLAAAVVSGVSIGVAAGALQTTGKSLLVLQPLATGALLAVLLIGAGSIAGLRAPRWPVALLAAVLVVATQHVWLYGAVIENRQREAAKQPAVELFRPGWTDQSFWSYMRSEASPRTVAFWALDACLLAGAAIAMVEVNARRPREKTDFRS